jgi:methyl-accepting chemotaxis protein
MIRLVHAVSSSTGPEAGADLVTSLREKLGADRPALVVCFSSMSQPLGEVLAAVKRAFDGVAVVGSSTAGEFTESGEHSKSAVAVAIVGDFQAHATMVTGVRADAEKAALTLAEGAPPRAPGYPHRTAILFFDGLAGVGEELTLTCASALGPDVQIAGAAAGDDWQIAGTLVGAGGEAAVDGAALAVLDSRVPLAIGVAHGHKSTGRRARVTKSEGSVVHELDGKPAWVRYAELTKDLGVADHQVDPEGITDAGERLQFFSWYQTGIALGGSYKNRSPLGKTDGDAIAFACGIPVGTELEILHSNNQAQVDSARAAAEEARARLGGAKVAGALVFECACRKVYLGQRFDVAPEAVAAALGDAQIAGFEAYGEVALNVGDFSGFHNATTVVLAFPADSAS